MYTLCYSQVYENAILSIPGPFSFRESYLKFLFICTGTSISKINIILCLESKTKALLYTCVTNDFVISSSVVP